MDCISSTLPHSLLTFVDGRYSQCAASYAVDSPVVRTISLVRKDAEAANVPGGFLAACHDEFLCFPFCLVSAAPASSPIFVDAYQV